MTFKQFLGIENPRWTEIGQLIAEITKQKLNQQGKTASDLTNHLRGVGNQYIEPRFVEEYLSGKSSFGVFFPQFRDYFGITAADVFRNVSQDEAQKHLKSLDTYLTDSQNPESLVIFMKYKPGKELREYVRDFLAKKRQEQLDKPYQSFTVGLGVEPEEFDKMLWDTVQEHNKIKSISERCNETGLVLAKLPELSVTMTPDNDLGGLYQTIIKRINEKVKSGWSRYSSIEDGSVIKIAPAYMRGKFGITIDFYMNPDKFDMIVSGECNKEQDDHFEKKGMRRMYMGLSA